MARATGIDDLFGHVPQAGELTLAGALEPAGRDDNVLYIDGVPLLRPTGYKHTPDSIRTNLHNILAHVRVADAMPWDAYYLRYFTGMFVNKAEWLKGGEGDALMAQFKAELDRLGAPDDQVAPNWQRYWAIAA